MIGPIGKIVQSPRLCLSITNRNPSVPLTGARASVRLSAWRGARAGGLDLLRVPSGGARAYPALLFLGLLALRGTAMAQTPGTGNASQVRGAESVPTSIQRQEAVTTIE